MRMVQLTKQEKENILENLIAKINFVNKFGDKTDLQINVKKILDGEL